MGTFQVCIGKIYCYWHVYTCICYMAFFPRPLWPTLYRLTVHKLRMKSRELQHNFITSWTYLLFSVCFCQAQKSLNFPAQWAVVLILLVLFTSSNILWCHVWSRVNPVYVITLFPIQGQRILFCLLAIAHVLCVVYQWYALTTPKLGYRWGRIWIWLISVLWGRPCNPISLEKGRRLLGIWHMLAINDALRNF